MPKSIFPFQTNTAAVCLDRVHCTLNLHSKTDLSSQFVCPLTQRESSLSRTQTVSSIMAAEKRRIRVFNLEARGLRVGDSGGSSDPYAILSIGNWRQQTSVQKRTLEPVWVDADYKLDESKIDFNKHFTLRIDLKDKVR